MTGKVRAFDLDLVDVKLRVLAVCAELEAAFLVASFVTTGRLVDLRIFG